MPTPASSDRDSFVAHLSQSHRILAVLGAGISASSGLPTFRGAGGYWRRHDATSLATPNAFRHDPGLVWQFYSYRRHMALNAKPNRAHLALAALARARPEFLTLSQNVDNLSPRAGHPESQLKLLHGNLFDVKCWDERNCGFVRHKDFTDPIVPALALPEDQDAVDGILRQRANGSNLVRARANLLERHVAEKNARVAGQDLPAESGGGMAGAVAAVDGGVGSTTTTAAESVPRVKANTHALVKGFDIANADVPINQIPVDQLPQCPKCEKNLLRPGVVWFGENLPTEVLDDVDEFLNDSRKIDLCLVIGTSAQVWPAAGFSAQAKGKGARVAVFNMDEADAKNLDRRDWFFEGDAAVTLPELLKSVVGEIGEFQES